ncbi:CRISPR-associated protein Cmr1 [Thermosyntropha lipolytica DSM 11003]|uniref:CRISPR-associated protein Cmr1 n=1 Tax=Thermosyntropha lipolytica DSM 11003 TaxID=1123382 RepID=A0A1M5RNT4_9FIRM|nr:RAMP superfamily CRISPR-associated protein [Thermosyntropha lipolytica]SHH27892.1 CRISPR-associated protein Cmr1 [Thermosyntropha lipolytica DSM 11003]
MRKQIQVYLETVTPLRTGGAYQVRRGIRSSSLLGSLRFWFETICYAGGLVGKKDFDKGRGQFTAPWSGEDLKSLILENGSAEREIIKILLEKRISLPDIIFGTTGWQGRIFISEIKIIKVLKNPFTSSFLRQSGIHSSDDFFWGKCAINFATDDFIAESILYPLLAFMDRYGFWGSKWNLGWGRLQVLDIKERGGELLLWEEGENQFRFSFWGGKDKKFTDLVEKVTSFEDLTSWESGNCRIKALEKGLQKKRIEEILKALIEEKKQKRCVFAREEGEEEKAKMHQVFGTVEKPPPDAPHGSKILPWVYRKGDKYQTGFISITSLLNL